MATIKRAYLAAIVTLLLLGGYFYSRHRQEQGWLYQKAHEIVVDGGARTRREKVFALRDYIRRHVRWEGVSQEGRPFLRASAWETLRTGKGYCGEAARVLINLAEQLGILAQRVNLYGPIINHVVAEVQIDPGGAFILVDPQDNPTTNPYLDERDRTLDEVIGASGAMFHDYSNLNLRRVPIVSLFVTRVRARESGLTRLIESPWLVLAVLCLLLAGFALLAFGIDRLLLRRFYAFRFGVSLQPSGSGPPAVVPIVVPSDSSLVGPDPAMVSRVITPLRVDPCGVSSTQWP
jgi:hypothetical protein